MYRTYNYSRDHNPYFDPNRVIIPFTHDWGSCLAFEWYATLSVLEKTEVLKVFALLQECLGHASGERTVYQPLCSLVYGVERDGGS